MKTKQQVVEAMFQVLSTKLDHPYLSAFHTDSRMREDLALDSTRSSSTRSGSSAASGSTRRASRWGSGSTPRSVTLTTT